MKKLNLFFITIALTLVSGILTSCDNSLVTALLRGPAQLDNITISAVDSSGNDAELNYGLQPNFTPGRYDYFVMIPRYTSKMVVEGISFRGAAVKSYKLVTAGNTIEKNRGEFYDFEYPAKSAMLYLTVDRDGMDTTVYTLAVYRVMPAWITSITFTTKVQDSLDTYTFPLSPGYNSINTDYAVGVNYNANSFSLNVVRRSMFEPGDSTGISISYSLQDGTPVSPTDIPFPYDQLFPNDPARTTMEKIINVTASFPEEDPNPVTYTIKVRRPSKVVARTGIVYGDERCFALAGEEKDYRFQQGEAVSFSVTPPFGYTTAGITAVSNNRQVSLFKTGNTYSFIMPGSEVVLTGQWTEIPKATYTNVRYVYENGRENEDGSQWCKASKDLQKLIDGYTGIYPNNYEIWIAKGTINPNWAWVSGGSRPSWASEVAADQQTWDHWAFVLKNGVKIYGGFAGTEITQADKNSRNISANETILSGYKDGAGYTRHLVIAVEINQPTVLEGVTITKSEAGGRVTKIKIKGETIIATLEDWAGAGIYTVNCTNDMVFNKLTITKNFTMYGGGAFNADSSPIFRQCTFSNNSAYSFGGAMHNSGLRYYEAGTSAPIIENCIILGNQAGSYGGGINHNGTAGSMMTVVNTLVTSNFAPYITAGIYASGPIKLINVSIVKNSGSADLCVTDVNSIIHNTIAWGNAADSSVSVAVNGGAGITVDNRIQGYNGIISTTDLGLNTDCTLQSGSVCIDAGDDSAYETNIGPLSGAKDLANHNRRNGSSIDIGAYEY